MVYHVSNRFKQKACLYTWLIFDSIQCLFFQCFIVYILVIFSIFFSFLFCCLFVCLFFFFCLFLFVCLFVFFLCVCFCFVFVLLFLVVVVAVFFFSIDINSMPKRGLLILALYLLYFILNLFHIMMTRIIKISTCNEILRLPEGTFFFFFLFCFVLFFFCFVLFYFVLFQLFNAYKLCKNDMKAIRGTAPLTKKRACFVLHLKIIFGQNV